MTIEYKKLVELYEEVAAGNSEPDVMWMSGERVKFMARRHHGVTDTSKLRDIDGNRIRDYLCYALTSDGIIPVDEEGHRVRIQ